MDTLIVIFQWLQVLALIGLIGAVIYLVMTALRVKNGLMGDAKRLYEPPLRSGKNLVAAGKGVALQEIGRAKRVATVVKGTAAVVKDTASDAKEAIQGVNLSDLKPYLVNAQNVLRILSITAQFARFAPKQKPKGA